MCFMGLYVHIGHTYIQVNRTLLGEYIIFTFGEVVWVVPFSKAFETCTFFFYIHNLVICFFLQMSFGDEDFSVVLDKGTLDALMVDGSEDVVATVDRMFSEIVRVLRPCGRYVCISLMQDHILRKLVAYFTHL